MLAFAGVWWLFNGVLAPLLALFYIMCELSYTEEEPKNKFNSSILLLQIKILRIDLMHADTRVQNLTTKPHFVKAFSEV